MLNAPLAAILVVELTNTVSIAMPALLLAIVAASLTNTGLFGSARHTRPCCQLRRIVPDDLLNQLLHRTDVTAMDSPSGAVSALLRTPPTTWNCCWNSPPWCLVNDGEDLTPGAGRTARLAARNPGRGRSG